MNADHPSTLVDLVDLISGVDLELATSFTRTCRIRSNRVGAHDASKVWDLPAHNQLGDIF